MATTLFIKYVDKARNMRRAERSQPSMMSYMQLPEDQRELSPRDYDLIRTLRTHCRQEGLTRFSSDTFRMLGLDRFVDTKHGIGGWFARLKYNEKARPIGWTRSILPSNHGRKIRVYEWCDDAEDRMRRDLLTQP